MTDFTNIELQDNTDIIGTFLCMIPLINEKVKESFKKQYGTLSDIEMSVTDNNEILFTAKFYSKYNLKQYIAHLLQVYPELNDSRLKFITNYSFTQVVDFQDFECDKLLNNDTLNLIKFITSILFNGKRPLDVQLVLRDHGVQSTVLPSCEKVYQYMTTLTGMCMQLIQHNIDLATVKIGDNISSFYFSIDKLTGQRFPTAINHPIDITTYNIRDYYVLCSAYLDKAKQRYPEFRMKMEECELNNILPYADSIFTSGLVPEP